MCGIAGIIGSSKIENFALKMQLACDSLKHRGPDNENYYINTFQNVALAHTRLSIIDLSKKANQPFKYLHYITVYNGEIYNFLEIKKILLQKGYQFTTQNDTEVLVAAFDCWGNECVQYFDGMFAFVIYNTNNQTIFAARDAFGEKPFYYSLQNNQLFFASEIQTLFTLGVIKQHNFSEWINYLSLGHTSNCNNTSTSFYENILHLPQGHFVEFKIQDKLDFAPQKWYDLQNIKVDYHQVEEQFKQIFETSISNKLITDVPLATSLSGGVDSSCIVAAINNLQPNSHYSFKTFTASFNGFEKDETIYSKAICDKLGIKQILIQPTAQDLIKEIPLLLKHQQEPTQSASVFTQWMVYKTAAAHGIKAIIDGQGADEILGGYSKQMEWFLIFLKQENYTLYTELKSKLLQNEFISRWGKEQNVAAYFPTIMQKMANAKNAYTAKNNSFLDKNFVDSYCSKATTQKPIIDSFKSLLHYHTSTFGLPSLLRYADRNAMAFGLEVRLPFLSKTVAPFLYHLPNHYKVQNGFSKHILRNYLANNNLLNIAWRKGKIGFEPPQQQWMQNKAVQQLIMDAKQVLLKEKIINHKYALQSVVPTSAHGKNNIDWRVLNMALLLKS